MLRRRFFIGHLRELAMTKTLMVVLVTALSVNVTCLLGHLTNVPG
jgi:hypothetical protein